MNLDIKGFKKVKFNSEECKKLIEDIWERVDDRLTNMERKRSLMLIIGEIGKLYPEDGRTISRLFSFETYRKALMEKEKEKRLAKRGKVKMVKEVFAGPGSVFGLNSDEEEGCENCPDKMVKKIEVGMKKKGVGFDEENEGRGKKEEYELPEELFDEDDEEEGTDPAEVKEMKLSDVETVEDGKKFLRYGERPAVDIVEEIKSWFVNNNIEFDRRNKKLEVWVEYWVEKLNEKA